MGSVGAAWSEARDAADTDLARRFRRGDEGAFDEVYQQFSGPMFTTAYQVLRDREMAADAVQQAFIQAWRNADSFDTNRDMQPWLCTIARRAAIDVHRRERHRLISSSLEEQRVDPAIDDPSFDQAWRSWQVRRALDQLHPDERSVLYMAYYLGMTQSEISMQQGIALGTVKSRTTRAQRNLAEKLAHLLTDAHHVPG